MNKPICLILILILPLVDFPAAAQKKNKDKVIEAFTLPEIVQMARAQSIASLQASTQRENSYWSYRVFRSNYNPQLFLQGTFPQFSHAIQQVPQQDGSYKYLPVNSNNTLMGLNLSQSIGQLGTTINVSSTLNRYDNFNNNESNYYGDPVIIGISQPIFRFNQLRWDSKIKPLVYEQSKKQYAENMEFISIQATGMFFDLLNAQISYEIATKNIANNDTIYQIGQGRYNMGKIAENDLLQLELNVMTAKESAAEASVNMETATLRLKSFIGINNVDSIYLLLPDSLPNLVIDETVALNQARLNRPEAEGYVINKLQAEQSLAQAKGQTGFNADLEASYGLSNQTIGGIPELYQNPQNSQIVNLSLFIPILDWGREKSSVKMAEANLKLTDYENQQDEMNFNEAISAQVKQFEMLHEQVKIAQRTDFIANKKYEISKNRYLIGETDIIQLNLDLQAKDEAKQNYITSLRNYWTAYYTLRQLTLYDFAKKTSLYADKENK